MNVTELKSCPINLDLYIDTLHEISLEEQTQALENILKYAVAEKPQDEQIKIIEKIVKLITKELTEIYELTPEFANDFSPENYKITLFERLDIYGLLRMYKTADKEFNNEKGKKTLIRNAISSHLLKTSLTKKLNKLDWNFNKLKDLIRFTIEKEDFGSIDNLVEDSLKVVDLMKIKGYILLESEAKYDEGTKYSDITLQFINSNRKTAFTPNGMIVEVKFQSKIGVKAKDKETPIYNLRRDLADEIRQKLDTIFDSSDFRGLVNSFLGDHLDQSIELTLESVKKFVNTLKCNVDCNHLLVDLQEYKRLLTMSRLILQDVPSIINSKEDAKKFEERFVTLNSDSVRQIKLLPAINQLRKKYTKQL